MRWKARIRIRRSLPKNDPRFLIMKAIELKSKADKMSDEADGLYELALKLRRDARVKAQRLQM